MPKPNRRSPRSDNREALDRLFHRLQSEFGPASARAITRAILEEMGGLRVSIPDLDELHREERDARIRAAFNGRNYEELAIRWNLSVRRVRYIIDRQAARRPAPED